MRHSWPNHLALEEGTELLSIVAADAFNTLDLLAVLEDYWGRELVKGQEILGLGVLGDVDGVSFDWVAGLLRSSPKQVIQARSLGLSILRDSLLGKLVNDAFVAVDEAVHAGFAVDGGHHLRAAVETLQLASASTVNTVMRAHRC